MNTKTDLLTSGAWRMVSYKVNPAYDYDGDRTDDSDLFALFEPCEKDDTQTFKKDGTGISDQGSLNCDPSDPQSGSITWNFFNNQTQLRIETRVDPLLFFHLSSKYLSLLQVD